MMRWRNHIPSSLCGDARYWKHEYRLVQSSLFLSASKTYASMYNARHIESMSNVNFGFERRGMYCIICMSALALLCVSLDCLRMWCRRIMWIAKLHTLRNFCQVYRPLKFVPNHITARQSLDFASQRTRVALVNVTCHMPTFRGSGLKLICEADGFLESVPKSLS